MIEPTSQSITTSSNVIDPEAFTSREDETLSLSYYKGSPCGGISSGLRYGVNGYSGQIGAVLWGRCRT